MWSCAGVVLKGTFLIEYMCSFLENMCGAGYMIVPVGSVCFLVVRSDTNIYVCILSSVENMGLVLYRVVTP